MARRSDLLAESVGCIIAVYCYNRVVYGAEFLYLILKAKTELAVGKRELVGDGNVKNEIGMGHAEYCAEIVH